MQPSLLPNSANVLPLDSENKAVKEAVKEAVEVEKAEVLRYVYV